MDRTNGYDIGPDEDRRMTVDVLTGLSTEPGAEGEPVYEQYYLNRPANSMMYEPLDLSDRKSPVDSTRSEHQKFQSERERLNTFDGVWKPEYNVTKEDLARDGFIYKGPGDLVMCVFCLKSIRKWDKEDSVPGEHKRLYPRCPWVREKVHHLNVPISNKDTWKRNMRLTAKGQPEISDMRTVYAREQTFKEWVKRDKVTVGALVKAGLFYDRYNDILTCYHCGDTTHGWDIEDNVLGHHDANCLVTQSQQSGHNTLPDPSMDVEIPEHQGNENGAGASVIGEVNIDEDMQSPAVQAIVTSYGDDYSMDAIRDAVQALRISGKSGPIHSEAILRQLDPDLDG